MSTKSETGSFLWFLVKLVIIVVAFRSFVISPFSIPSESMQPRLLIGDYLFVSKWSYGYSRYSLPFHPDLFSGRIFGSLPERGDVVVFAAPRNQNEDWIKRVIGLPGDRVQVRDGVTYLNGRAIPRQRLADFVIPVTLNMIAAARADRALSPCFRPDFEENDAKGNAFCRYPRFRETLPGGRSYEVLDLIRSEADDTPVFVVPEGHVFVMGDNRDRSADSRFSPAQSGVGLLPVENLVGKAMVSFFSTDGSANWLLPWTWFSAARFSRIGEGF